MTIQIAEILNNYLRWNLPLANFATK